MSLSDREFEVLRAHSEDGPPTEVDSRTGLIIRVRLSRRGLLTHDRRMYQGFDCDWFSITNRGRITVLLESVMRTIRGTR